MVVKKTNPASGSFQVESLEARQMMAVLTGYWEKFLGLDKIAQNYPWLDGGTNGIAIIDKGIDYFHPVLGGNEATNKVAPRIVNVHDYKDGDNLPFPDTDEHTDVTSAHATGVAGVIAANGYKDQYNVYHQGVLTSPESLLYNLRTNSADSQNTIKLSLQWVLANHALYNITAINLTDFIGSFANTAVYATVAQQLKAAGVFIVTPVANDWLDPVNPRYVIGLPAKDPSIFGIGGIQGNGTLNRLRDQTQRGPGLDLVGPADGVTLPYYIPSTNSHIIVSGYGVGNSWACAYTTATAIMLQQIDPSITPDEIMQILKDSGTPTLDNDTVSNPDQSYDYSSLNSYAAVQLAYTRRDDIYDQGKGGSDDLAHAGVINLNNGAGSITNLKLLMHDVDYYTFTIDSPNDYKVSVGYGGSSAFPPAQLLDADGNAVATITQGGIVRRLTAGTYYIKLLSDSTLSGLYSVAVGEDAPIIGPSTPGQNGTFNSIAYDPSGNLNFAWFDAQAGRLDFAKRTGSVWSAPVVVDGAAHTGNFMSMSLDNNGLPAIAYYDETNTALKYAHFNGSTWSLQTVDSAFTTGYYPSIKFDANNHPAIAYYYKSSGDLRLATNNGSVWSITTIDSKGDVGRYPSLALNGATGRWGIAYEKTTSGDFRYAEQLKKGGWSITVVDPTRGGGGFASLAYDNNGLPAFSYYDAYNADLKFARFSAGKWSTKAIAAKGSQGLYTNMFFDSGNNFLPVIYYFNKTANAAMVARNQSTGWQFETVATAGGRQLSVALDANDFETFAYLDDATGDLKVAQPV